MPELADIMRKGGDRLAVLLRDTGPHDTKEHVIDMLAADEPLRDILRCALWMQFGWHPDRSDCDCQACFARDAIKRFTGDQT